MDRDVKALLKLAGTQGWTHEVSKHIKLRSPTGELFVVHKTASDHRGMKNMVARLRRAGLVINRKGGRK